MDKGTSRQRRVARAAMHGLMVIVATAHCGGTGQAADMKRDGRRVEIVRFANTQVRVVRGASPGGTLSTRHEIVSFRNGTAHPLRSCSAAR